MAGRKKPARKAKPSQAKPARKRAAASVKPARRPARPTRPSAGASISRRLDDVAETLAIMVPELAARLAAVEHLLIERKICRHDDLRHARAFIDLRRGEG
jgi:hypothetical protein